MWVCGPRVCQKGEATSQRRYTGGVVFQHVLVPLKQAGSFRAAGSALGHLPDAWRIDALPRQETREGPAFPIPMLLFLSPFVFVVSVSCVRSILLVFVISPRFFICFGFGGFSCLVVVGSFAFFGGCCGLGGCGCGMCAGVILCDGSVFYEEILDSISAEGGEDEVSEMGCNICWLVGPVIRKGVWVVEEDVGM